MKTDKELEQALTAILPDYLIYGSYNSPEPMLHWKDDRYEPTPVLDEEMLFVCQLAENALKQPARLDNSRYNIYLQILEDVVGHIHDCVSATWQQRTAALVKVMEILNPPRIKE